MKDHEYTGMLDLAGLAWALKDVNSYIVFFFQKGDGSTDGIWKNAHSVCKYTLPNHTNVALSNFFKPSFSSTATQFP